MTEAKCVELKDDPLFTARIRREARRHFGRTEDAECAEAEAWEKLQQLPDDLERDHYLYAAVKAIRAMYQRHYRRRKQLTLPKA